jgi:hypothetical protein
MAMPVREQRRQALRKGLRELPVVLARRCRRASQGPRRIDTHARLRYRPDRQHPAFVDRAPAATARKMAAGRRKRVGFISTICGPH